MKRITSAILVSLSMSFFTNVLAQQLNCDKSYAFRADVSSAIGDTICTSKATKFVDVARDFSFSNLGYTLTSPAQIQARFSDVSILFNYAQNSNTFVYNFVELGVAGSFTGATRKDAQNQFVDYVKKSDILGRIIKYQSSHSITSPVTGVGGIIPLAGAADFSSGFDTMSKSGAGGTAGEEKANNLIGAGVNFGSYTASGTSDKVTTTTLPLSYTIRNGIDPRRQLVFSLPITQSSIGNAHGYQVGAGVAYRLPLSDAWTIAPGARYSIVAAPDRATISSVMSASMMSTYTIPTGNSDIVIGNMLGYYRTGKLSSGSYAINPNIALVMTRNGVLFATPTTLFEQKLSAEISLVDARYLGKKPFLSNTQELSLTLGTNKRAAIARSYTRLGATFLHGKDVRGFSVNLNYWF